MRTHVLPAAACTVQTLTNLECASVDLYSYGKPLIGEGLTIGSKSDPGTATQALGDWARQFGINAGDDAAEQKGKKTQKKTPIGERTKPTMMKEKKKGGAPQIQKNSKGASPHMKLGGANNHVHVLLKQDIVSCT